MRFKKTLGTILTAILLAGGCRDRPVTSEYQHFNGNSGNYKVEITLEERGNNINRMIHLNGKTNSIVPYGLTGHDYDGDRKWDRIFIQETPQNGFNAVYFDKGKTIWEPCGADKNKIKPFTDSQINEARSMLDKATEAFEKPEYKQEK